MRRTLCWVAIGIAVSLPGRARAADPLKFEWKDGDLVVLIGDTLIERDQKYGYLETLITARNPDKTITFRNLGWSGDTVYGHARAGFGKPADGFKNLTDHVDSLWPTVLIVGYGMAESFDARAGQFAGLTKLLKAVKDSRLRLILLSPIAHEDLGRPLPDPTAHNQWLQNRVVVIKTIARERSAWLVDLYAETVAVNELEIGPLTDNGIHPTEFGHWYLGAFIDKTLKGWFNYGPTSVEVDLKGPSGSAVHAAVSRVSKTESGVRFTVTDETLPPPLPPAGLSNVKANRRLGYFPRHLFVKGLSPGRYTLRIDGGRVAVEDAASWTDGVWVSRGPEIDQVESLRRAINAKNELYFYRWRPQNETYLFGFRKKEQGNNAREVPLFDPLVEEKEKEIAGLRKPTPHDYELTRESEAAR